MQTPEEKIIALDEALKLRHYGKCYEKKFPFVITNGCFDILHRGHLEYLQKAKELAEPNGVLIVLINNDESVRRLKSIYGDQRPINNEKDRAYQLASLSCVDGVVICDLNLYSDDKNIGPRNNFAYEIYALKPDIYVKGGDYNYDSLNYEELTALQRVNAEIKFIPFVKGYSTTNIIRKIKGSLCETDLSPFKHLNK